MSINFPAERWKKLEKDYTAWWEGKLDRPLINIQLKGADPQMPKPAEPIYDQTFKYPVDTPAETIVKHWEYMLSGIKYLGDAYPYALVDFGAGSNAGFMGARWKADPTTVWFFPPENISMDTFSFKYDPQNPLLVRTKEIYRTAAAHFKGSVCLGMTHLNNGIDPVERFFPGEELALAFYDYPDDLKRLIWENHELCMKYFDEVAEAAGPDNPGYTCWGGMFSKKPHFIWQSDSSVMISPDMFREFVLPELEACCRKVENSFYHLDGAGELKHLDMILKISGLKGVQWIPGDGAPDYKHWPEIYRKIRDAGLLIQLFGDLDTIEVLADQLGSAKGLYYHGEADISREYEVMRLLNKFGATD